MTNIFTVHFQSNPPSNSLKYDVNTRNLRKKALSSLFRMKSILKQTNSLEIKDSISKKVIKRIARKVIITESLANIIISLNLSQIRDFSQFMGTYPIIWGHSPAAQYRKARIYLHKIHKIAPVFNYQRATFNLRSLQTFFYLTSIWPQISTQLTLTIYITDKIGYPNRPILSGNIRALTHCSAYAFYQNKKILTEKGVLTEHE